MWQLIGVNRSGQRTVMLCGVLLGLLLCLWLASAKHASGAVAAQAPDEVTLTITNDGFAPAELTRTAGRFMLSVDNRSNAAALSLRVNNEDGSLVRDFKVPANTLDWSEAIELPAGHYTLTEAEHPQWVCRITVQ